RAPYWTFPADLGDATIALNARDGHTAVLMDCMGISPVIAGRGLLARMDATSHWYIRPPLAAAALGRFLSATCADTTHYPLPADPFYPYLSITVPVAAAGSTIYVAVDVPAAARVDGIGGEICDSCAFDQGVCQPRVPATVTPVSSSFYARLPISPAPWEERKG